MKIEFWLNGKSPDWKAEELGIVWKFFPMIPRVGEFIEYKGAEHKIKDIMYSVEEETITIFVQ
jgi:hypothetical protein